jgi:DNA (cytosine-5)-methyltransferase 1
VAQPAVDFWRGERIAFPGAKVFEIEDDGLSDALRSAVERARDNPIAVDLFCGAGGLTLGLEQSGFSVVLGVDDNATSCETHAEAFEGVTVRADLSRPLPLLRILRRAGIRRVDLVAGGPPCQPFSRAGRSKIRSLEQDSNRKPDERPQLWLAFMRFVSALNPSFVLLENVPDLVLWEGGQTIRQICGSLESRGYAVEARALDCWRFGVPQHRKRLFVIGSRDCVPWPAPDELQPTLRDAIGDLPKVSAAQRTYWVRHTRPARTALQRRLRGRASRVSDHVTRDIRPDDREAFRLMQDGTRYEELPPHLRRYRSDIFDDKYHVLGWNELSRSITAHIAKDGYWYIHPREQRTLSIREAARLQTFPDHFRFAGHPSDRLRQIGNAVPVEVARRFGVGMLGAMRNGHESAPVPGFRATDFRRRLLAWHRRASRDYPWRQTDDAWLVLATEVLLRRTRADAVARIWPQFRKRFSTPRSVARDPFAVRQVLEPLGLRWRVDNLIECARILARDFGGKVPLERAALKKLPGVGDYVADAVLAFAGNERAVLVDSNTARIASRVFGLPTKWTSLRNLDLRASVARLGGVRPPTAEVNLALLDLGGQICVAGRPRCEECPVRSMCVVGQMTEPRPEVAP